MSLTEGPELSIIGFDPTATDQIANALEHIEGNHHDSLLFAVARGGRLDGDIAGAASVTVSAIDPDGLDVILTEVDAPERRLLFTEPIATVRDFQAQFRAMMAAAREGSPDHAVTSIEAEIAATAALVITVGTVSAVKRIAANLLEITIGGLDEVPVRGGDEFHYLMVARPGAVDALSPDVSMQELQALPEDQQPIGAYYTARARRPEAGEMDVWVVLHSDDHGVSGWASSAEPGESVALWGPRRGYEPPEGTTSHLLVADETGLAAVAAIIELLPEGHEITAVLETAGPDCRPPMPEQPGLHLHWCDRNGAAPGTSGSLERTVRGLAGADGGVYAFGAAESREIKEVRRYLRYELGLPATQVHMTGYWRRDDES
ncbi:MAG: siderophore-interacting protein [Actinomycetota bacterium]